MRNDGIYLSHPYMIHSPEEGGRKMSKALEALMDALKYANEAEQNTTTWLGDYCPYRCEHCGRYVDSKERYCPNCGRKAVNYEN